MSRNLSLMLMPITSTFLNMIVIPALYMKFGGAEARVKTEDYPRESELAMRT